MKKILESAKLTNYATETRYPDDYSKITEDEYKEAIILAEKVYDWALKQIG